MKRATISVRMYPSYIPRTDTLATRSGGGGHLLGVATGAGQERDMDRLPQTPWQHIIEGVDRILVCLFQKSIEKKNNTENVFVATHSPGKDP